jgi:hypothetical protein
MHLFYLIIVRLNIYNFQSKEYPEIKDIKNDNDGTIWHYLAKSII